jgi:hypothetical protein
MSHFKVSQTMSLKERLNKHRLFLSGLVFDLEEALKEIERLENLHGAVTTPKVETIEDDQNERSNHPDPSRLPTIEPR